MRDTLEPGILDSQEPGILDSQQPGILDTQDPDMEDLRWWSAYSACFSLAESCFRSFAPAAKLQ